MLSISTTMTAKDAQSYHQKENYYQDGNDLGRWYGSSIALSQLGLEKGAKIEGNDFKNILLGFDAAGQNPLAKNAGNPDRKAGIDLTFSAPKSVSILRQFFEISKDEKRMKEIEDAHKKAVHDTMQLIAEKYAKTRVRLGGKTQEIVDAKIVYASFQHDATRAVNLTNKPLGKSSQMGKDFVIDPALHTHNFVMNTVFGADRNGELKSFSLLNGEFFTNKMYLGQRYRNILASELSRLGYEIEVTNTQQGLFEVKGFTEDQLITFSSRSVELSEAEAALRNEGKITTANRAKAKDLANAKTKTSKGKVDREELLRVNARRFADSEIDKSIDKISHSSYIYSEPEAHIVENIVEKAIVSLEQNHSIFKMEDVLKNAMKLSLQYGLSEEGLYIYIDKKLAEKRLIQFDKNAYSTDKIVKAEHYVRSQIVKTKNKLSPIFSDLAKIEKYIDKNYPTMSRGQRAMMEAILTTNSQYIAIQGDAGSGKTYSAQSVKQFLENTDVGKAFDIIGTSFTGKAAEGLEADSGIASQTLHSYINQEKKAIADGVKYDKKRIIIVDETGMAGSIQVAELMKIAEERGDRVVFIGDTKQFSSIAAGRIFADMQKIGIETTEMKEVFRQKTEHAKAIVNAIKTKKYDEAFRILSMRKQIHEVKDYHEASLVAAGKYAKSITKTGGRDPLSGSMVIASRNAVAAEVNALIRQELGLAGKGSDFDTLAPVSAGSVGQFSTDQIKPGMIVQGHKVPGLNSRNTFRVKEIVNKNEIIVEADVKNPTPTKIDVSNYGEHLQFFQSRKTEFAIDDVVIFGKNGLSVKNGERAVIREINENEILVTDGKGEKTKRVNIDEYPYIAHGYAITDIKSQGATVDDVIVVADSSMTSFNSIYTQVTRAKNEIEVITTNLEEMRANLEKSRDAKTTLSYQSTSENDDKLPTKQIKLKKGVYDVNRIEAAKNIKESQRSKKMGKSAGFSDRQQARQTKDDLRKVSDIDLLSDKRKRGGVLLSGDARYRVRRRDRFGQRVFAAADRDRKSFAEALRERRKRRGIRGELNRSYHSILISSGEGAVYINTAIKIIREARNRMREVLVLAKLMIRKKEEEKVSSVTANGKQASKKSRAAAALEEARRRKQNEKPKPVEQAKEEKKKEEIIITSLLSADNDDQNDQKIGRKTQYHR